MTNNDKGDGSIFKRIINGLKIVHTLMLLT
jgi:hypothetical protein